MGVPSVLIMTPIYDKKDYCLKKFLEHSNNISYPNKKHIFIDNSEGMDYTKKLRKMGLIAYHVERGQNTRESLARAQNFGRRYAIENKFDYLFSLESDVMVHPDIIQRLMIHGKNVISGVYLIGAPGQPIRIPCITLPEWHPELGAFGTRLLKPEEWQEYVHKGIKQVQAAAFGCCLIHKSIFSTVTFYYDARFMGHSDVYFFNEMFKRREAVWVDTDLFCDHDNSDWAKVEDR
jgi:hypothetical protein